jgi:hypothetical protein
MPDVPDFFSLNCVAGVVFSAFGFIVFTYGKRMRYWTPMLCGLALMLLPLLWPMLPCSSAARSGNRGDRFSPYLDDKPGAPTICIRVTNSREQQH